MSYTLIPYIRTEPENIEHLIFDSKVEADKERERLEGLDGDVIYHIEEDYGE